MFIWDSGFKVCRSQICKQSQNYVAHIGQKTHLHRDAELEKRGFEIKRTNKMKVAFFQGMHNIYFYTWALKQL